MLIPVCTISLLFTAQPHRRQRGEPRSRSSFTTALIIMTARKGTRAEALTCTLWSAHTFCVSVRIVSMSRPRFLIAVIDAWHTHASFFVSLLTLTNEFCFLDVCLYLDLDGDVAAAAAVSAVLHVFQDTDGDEVREGTALPSLQLAPPRRSPRRRVSIPETAPPPPPRPPPSPTDSPLTSRRAPRNRQAHRRLPPTPIPVPPLWQHSAPTPRQGGQRTVCPEVPS